MKDPMFDEASSDVELSAWQWLKSEFTNFLGNHRGADYEKKIEELKRSFCQCGAWMSVKLHIQITLGLYIKELWRFEWTAEWSLSLIHFHYGRALPRPVGCKLSHWLLLVLETVYGGCQALEEVPEKTVHPWITSFVYFSVF